MEVAMHCRLIPVYLLAALAGAAPLQAQEARAIIEKAIGAHGGMDRLSRLQADRIKVKGSLYINEKAVPFTGETLIQLPTKLKNTFQLNLENRTIKLVQIVNAENAWVTLDGQPTKVEPTALAAMRESLALSRAMRLVPLLTDRTYELSALGESKVGERTALGVRVAVKGRKDLRLFFDKESGLLVKSEHTLDDGNGKELVQEEFYSDFRDLSGFKRPIKVLALRKGAKVMEAELLEVKYYDRFEDEEFKKP
jgi:hypothetical protein